MDETKIRKVVEQKLVEDDYKDCYLVDIEYNQAKNHLTVYLDSDSRMTLSKCQAFSRHIESYLDESLVLGEKYELDVSSPGVGRPLKLKRQYQNNVGRELKVTLDDESRMKGELVKVTEDRITLKVSKGKKQPDGEIEIPFEKIKTALVQIKF